MSQRRFLTLLAVALTALALALLLTGRHHRVRDTQGSLLLPALAADLNGVSAVTIRKGGAKPAVSLRRTATDWTVAERDDYPADVLKLRRLLLTLSEARLTEEKTSNPSSYALIGVEDPGKPGANGAEISIVAAHGTTRLIVGKPSGDGNFVRFAADTASYLAEPGISFETEPRYWIDSRLFDLPVATIQSLAVQPADGPAYALHRVSAEGDAFALDSVPAGRSAADAKTLAPSPTALGNLAADDVAAASSIDFSKPSTIVVALADGDSITLTGSGVGDKRWITVASTKNAALDAKSKGRAYAIPRYRFDAIFRPLENLLQSKPAASKPAAASTGAAASSKAAVPRPARTPPTH
ncbi:MAG TPA: DUF4340 domain-containing protein [Steroidobacteraceae bacterium]|nr:DUF4340 domain-containing protein [Steroidobacteraceae bacterium]